MTELQVIEQQRTNADIRFSERRKEVWRELDQLTSKPEREWNEIHRFKIRVAMLRLAALLPNMKGG